MKEKDLVKKIACVRDVAAMGKDVYPLALACTLIDKLMTWDERLRPGGRVSLVWTADKGNPA